MIQQAVLLCAGKGTRLGDISANQAKPLIEAAGKPFVSWFIEDLINVGVKDIVILTGHLGGQFELLRQTYSQVRLVTSNVMVNKGVLGIPGLADKFLVANGDCYPIFKESTDLGNLLTTSRRSTVCTKEKAKVVVDCGLAVVDKVSVGMGLINCGQFSSMIDILGHFDLDTNLHINNPEGLEGARTWLSGKTFTVSSQ